MQQKKLTEEHYANGWELGVHGMGHWKFRPPGMIHNFSLPKAINFSGAFSFITDSLLACTFCETTGFEIFPFSMKIEQNPLELLLKKKK